MRAHFKLGQTYRIHARILGPSTLQGFNGFFIRRVEDVSVRTTQGLHVLIEDGTKVLVGQHVRWWWVQDEFPRFRLLSERIQSETSSMLVHGKYFPLAFEVHPVILDSTYDLAVAATPGCYLSVSQGGMSDGEVLVVIEL